VLLTVKFIPVFYLHEYSRVVRLRESPELKDHPPCGDIPITRSGAGVGPRYMTQTDDVSITETYISENTSRNNSEYRHL
jgi:hypothetical protein